METVVIKFTGNVSIYPGTLLSILEEQEVYNFADERYGYSVIPNSPEIAEEIKIWGPSIKGLYIACEEVIWQLRFTFNRKIPVDIKIEGGEIT